MNKSRKSVLLKAIAMVCFFGVFAAYSQNSDISIKVDLLKKEIITYVTLREIPKGVDIIWQQKIPKEAHFSSQGRGNQNVNSKIIMMSFSKHLLSPTMSFSFICTIDTIGDWIIWGESSITYTTKEGKERLVKFPARLFIIADFLIEPAETLAQQELTRYLEENGNAEMSNIIVIAAPEEVETQPDIAVEPNQNIVKTEELAIDANKIALTVAQQESIAITIVPQELLSVTVEPQEFEPVPVPATVVPQEPEPEPIPVPATLVPQDTEPEPVPVPTTLVPQEPEPELVPVPATVEPQAPPQTEPSLKSGYYIQISAFKTKRNLSEIKDYVHLLKGDNLAEMKKEKFFVYLVGPFLTRKEASDKLAEHYRKYVPDAYVLKL